MRYRYIYISRVMVVVVLAYIISVTFMALEMNAQVCALAYCIFDRCKAKS